MGRPGVELRRTERLRTRMRWRLAKAMSELTGEGVLKCARRLRKAARSAATRDEVLEVHRDDGVHLVTGSPDLF